ncbi:MAG: hypothetical protein HC788_01220 [Sphingopyxis sp.]|nr:hypothetical protein [Sphingopyxis sp.]
MDGSAALKRKVVDAVTTFVPRQRPIDRSTGTVEFDSELTAIMVSIITGNLWGERENEIGWSELRYPVAFQPQPVAQDQFGSYHGQAQALIIIVAGQDTKVAGRQTVRGVQFVGLAPYLDLPTCADCIAFAFMDDDSCPHIHALAVLVAP